jgi:hypothetical protein
MTRTPRMEIPLNRIFRGRPFLEKVTLSQRLPVGWRAWHFAFTPVVPVPGLTVFVNNLSDHALVHVDLFLDRTHEILLTSVVIAIDATVPTGKSRACLEVIRRTQRVEMFFFEASALLKEVRPVASPYGFLALPDFDRDRGGAGEAGNVWETALEWPTATTHPGADAMAG